MVGSVVIGVTVPFEDTQCREPPPVVFVGCQSDQPEDGHGSGNTEDDCVVNPSGDGFCVRAEREGGDPRGRHYAVTVAASDTCGNTSLPVVIGYVYVPHSGGCR